MILSLMLIQLIICYIVDLSGVVESFKHAFWRWVKPGKPYKDFELKPFTCSRCMGWWTGLIYILCTGHFTIPYISFVALLSLLASTFSNLLQLFKDILDTLLYFITRRINKQ